MKLVKARNADASVKCFHTCTNQMTLNIYSLNSHRQCDTLIHEHTRENCSVTQHLNICKGMANIETKDPQSTDVTYREGVQTS